MSQLLCSSNSAASASHKRSFSNGSELHAHKSPEVGRFGRLTENDRQDIARDVQRNAVYALIGRDSYLVDAIDANGVLFDETTVKVALNKYCENNACALIPLVGTRNGVPVPKNTEVLCSDKLVRAENQKRLLHAQLESGPHVLLSVFSFSYGCTRTYLLPECDAYVLMMQIYTVCSYRDRAAYCPVYFKSMFNIADRAERKTAPDSRDAWETGFVNAFTNDVFPIDLLTHLAAVNHLILKTDEDADYSSKKSTVRTLEHSIEMPAQQQKPQAAAADGSESGELGFENLTYREEVAMLSAMNKEGRGSAMRRTEFYDRLADYGANQNMRDPLALILSVGYHVWRYIGNRKRHDPYFQTHLHTIYQLVRAERERNSVRFKMARAALEMDNPPHPANLVPTQAMADAAARVERAISAYTGLEYAERYNTKLADIAANVVYNCSPVDAAVYHFLKHVDFAALLAIMQQRRHHVVRQQAALIAGCQVVSTAEFENFLTATGQIFIQERLKKLRKGGAEVILRIPVNSDPNVIGSGARRRLRNQAGSGWPQQFAARREHDFSVYEQHISNGVRPQALVASVRALDPEARDGVDFLVVYAPESYRCGYTEPLAQGTKLFNRVSTRAHIAAVKSLEPETPPEALLLQQDAKRKRGRPKIKKVEVAKAVSKQPNAPPASALVRGLLPPAVGVDRAAFLWLSEQHRRMMEYAIGPMVLLQRATGRATLNRHMPLCGPAVAHCLATCNDVGPLCLALNALNALLGLACHQWQPTSNRARYMAKRTARLIVRVLNVSAMRYGTSLDDPDDRDAASFFFMRQTVHPMLDRHDALLYNKDAARVAQKAAQEATDEEKKKIAEHEAKQAALKSVQSCGGIANAIAVLLNGGCMPIVCNIRAANWLAVIHGEAHKAYFFASRRRYFDRCADAEWLARPNCTSKNEERKLAQLDATELQHIEAAKRRRLEENNHSIVECRCGTTMEFCVGMTAAFANAAKKGADNEYVRNWLCCLCAGDERRRPLTVDVTGRDSVVIDYCNPCRLRIPWDRADPDELVVPEYTEIWVPPSAIGINADKEFERFMQEPTSMTHLRLFTTALDAVEQCPPGDAKKVALDQALNFFGSVGLRMRNFRTAPAEPVTLVPAKNAAALDKALNDYTTNVTQALRDANAEFVSQLPPGAAETLRAGFNPTLTHILRQSHALMTTDAARAADIPSGHEALALWLTSLETATLVSRQALMQFTRNTEQALAVNDQCATEAHLNTWRRFIAPLWNMHELRCYSAAFNKYVGTAERYFALFESPLAESTAMGAPAAQTLMSDWRLDVAEKLANMLGPLQIPRPLMTMLPLLAEELLVNYYDPE